MEYCDVVKMTTEPRRPFCMAIQGGQKSKPLPNDQKIEL